MFFLCADGERLEYKDQSRIMALLFVGGSVMTHVKAAVIQGCKQQLSCSLTTESSLLKQNITETITFLWCIGRKWTSINRSVDS